MKERRWGATVFGGEDREVVRQLQGVEGRRRSEERRSPIEGGVWRSKMTIENWIDGPMRGWNTDGPKRKRK
jgi:hypothetical protein